MSLPIMWTKIIRLELATGIAHTHHLYLSGMGVVITLKKAFL